MNKLEFLQGDYLKLLAGIDPETKPAFGKMNAQQMVEHMSYAFKQASGLIPLESTQSEELIQKMYQFMISERPFKDNTPNPFLPDEPEPVVFANMSEAIIALQKDIHFFVEVFKTEPEKRIQNPFFGNLNQGEWIHLLHKHAWHHLRQFHIQPNS